MIFRAILPALAASGLLLCQQTAPGNPPDAASPTGAPADTPTNSAAASPQSPQRAALSVEDKLRYDGRHLFDVDNLVVASIGATFDQWRDRPGQWGEGWGALGERSASHVGQYLIQRSIMFPVQAIDHEDIRHFRSTRKTFKGRLGDALLHTIWRHADNGGMMPAFSEFLGDYGAAALSRFWWPRQYRTGSAIFIAGSDTVLVDAGINVLHEFKPEIKRWLHLSH